MFKMLLPIVLVVFSNVFYNICAKFTPTQANSFLSLTVTYITAAILSFITFFMTGNSKNIISEFSKLNWTALVLGISIVGLELGYIYVYRVGWKMGVGSLVASTTLACVLLIISVLFLKENISMLQVVGMLFCLVGLILITK